MVPAAASLQRLHIKQQQKNTFFRQFAANEKAVVTENL